MHAVVKTNTAAATPTVTPLPSALKLIERASGVLQKIGIDVGEAPHIDLSEELNDLSTLDESSVVVIARVLQAAPGFNDVVRKDVANMHVGDRYRRIAADFDSIRKDGERMLKQVEDGKLDLTERLSNTWMSITRGTIASRFEDIRKEAAKVFHDSDAQVRSAHAILEAYANFRLGVKQALVLAIALDERAQHGLATTKTALTKAQSAIAQAGEDAGAKARAELARDQALQTVQDADRRYQKAKNLAENLSNSHNVSDVVMARLNQTLQIHEQVLSQARTFMATNETVLTALNASFVSTQALHESSATIEALRDGINQGLESQADLGNAIQEQALRAAYGPGIKAESVKRLVDAIVDFQARQAKLTEELREQSTQAAKDIAREVENGRQRLAGILTHA